MRSENPRDGFDVWVIDPASGTVEQVDVDPAPAPRGARRTEQESAAQPALLPAPVALPEPVAPAVGEQPTPAKKRKSRRPGTPSKPKKQPAAKGTEKEKNPGTEKKRRPTTTAKPRVPASASGKKRANPRKRARAKDPVLAGVAASALSAAAAKKPTTRKPRPIRKTITPPNPSAAPAPASAHVPAVPAEQPAPTPHRPLLVASAADLSKPAPIREADVLMVMELVCGGPTPSVEEPPRHGSIDVRFVDIHE